MRLTFITILLIFAGAPLALANGGGSCSKVEVDCSTHKIKVDGKEETIGCGANNATKNGQGKVGGKHSGQVVTRGVDIKSPGMGQDGGGKVFHTKDPKGCAEGEPPPQDTSKGCIIVSCELLKKLETCEGASLTITGAGGGGGSGSSSSRSSSSGSGRK